MANEKDLSLLTIDGSTYRTVLTNPNIGKEYRADYAGSIRTVPGTQLSLIGNPLTIPEDGLYDIFVGVSGSGSTTGDCYRYITLDTNGIVEYNLPSVLPNNLYVWLTWQLMRELKKNDVIQGKLFSYADFSYSHAYLSIRRLPKYPDVVGGGNTNH